MSREDGRTEGVEEPVKEKTMKFKIFFTEFFGADNRFGLKTCRDRFGEPMFILEDHAQLDRCGLPKPLRFKKSRAEAVAGLAWETGDTCTACGHDGMTMTADDYQDLAGFVRGTLACPECGAFDEMALAQTDRQE